MTIKKDEQNTEMEKAQYERRIRAVADRDAQHRPAAKTALGCLNRTFHLCRQTGLKRADRRERRAVFILARKMKPQILQRQQTARGELFGNDIANAVQPGQRLRGDVIGIRMCGHALRRSSNGCSQRSMP